MKNGLLTIGLLITALAAGARQHKHKLCKNATERIESISMHRTGCYGRCPAYIITVNRKGVAHYTGVRFVTDTGTFKKKAGTALARRIFNQAVDNKVDTCQDQYKSPAPDLPGMIMTITYRHSVKKIDNANYGPSVLRELSEAMDSLCRPTLDNTWKKEK